MKSDRIVALMIGRGGSSMKDKNIRTVHGYPLLQWAAGAAQRSSYIGRYYISSDCDQILGAAQVCGYRTIKRPPLLALPDSQSEDAVRHAAQIISSEGPVDIVVVQHANVGTITETLIDECIEAMLSLDGVSCIAPCHQRPEYHPYRCRRLTDEGYLQPFVEAAENVSANRQYLPKALFYDHSIWVLHYERGINCQDGQKPWSCMGNKIIPIETHGCFDVHSEEDLTRTEQWLKDRNIPAPAIYGNPPESAISPIV